MSTQDIWGWGHEDTTGYSKGIDLVGYKVEATDGSIGKVDKHSEEVGASLIVVDTGVWIFGKHVLLPAGVITRIDTAARTVHVNRSKEQIKNAPEFEESQYNTGPSYLEQFARYYNQPHM
ncbi:PRC-barrel domain-containing protein [Streptomyces sp. NPDC059957]|uniref:PRC-barrel domain-containing protein n=1 Tax=unclassified Streptomyces TaxID=2593676 RepID=UPI003660F82C